MHILGKSLIIFFNSSELDCTHNFRIEKEEKRYLLSEQFPLINLVIIENEAYIYIYIYSEEVVSTIYIAYSIINFLWLIMGMQVLVAALLNRKSVCPSDARMLHGTQTIKAPSNANTNPTILLHTNRFRYTGFNHSIYLYSYILQLY